MAYMQLEYHDPSAELTPQEVVQIRHTATAKEQEIITAARSLRHIIESGEGSADVHRLLERFSFCTNTARIPKRFTLKMPSARLATGRSKKHSRLFYRQTHNRSYIRRLRRQRKVSVIENHYFQVPTTPLPLSFTAQLDNERARGSQGRRRGPTGSGYAPLFSKASTSPLASRELTSVERDALQCLKPSAHSPRAEMQEKLEAMGHYIPSDPHARTRFNEPKRMPNLHRRVPRGFTAACAQRQTCCFLNHCTANEERTAQKSGSKERAQWY
ncbi:hypothetical protein ABL78_6199 [Leptomonas seymouri]|uniref:Uncharacterized protein n=1 Tax=Leptomonas seymouri TaxID=5684 RepID=A0A0N1PD23_LEPSE|nr:hypothetical protein ABL78_6199 [Leptomonas seymouri]|eukprot:KPI84754.1 hypothetical protein ABL78_6199 [Leptomonas seymouri]